MPESPFEPNGEPLSEEELKAIALIKRKDVRETIRRSRIKEYLNAKVENNGST